MPLLYLFQAMRSGNTGNDTALWELVKQGGLAAFDQLYLLYADPVFALINKHIRHKADAEDIMQEVFPELWESGHHADPAFSFQCFSELLDKYLSGQYTPREKAVMETWSGQGDHTGDAAHPDKNRILANIHRRQEQHR